MYSRTSVVTVADETVGVSPPLWWNVFGRLDRIELTIEKTRQESKADSQNMRRDMYFMFAINFFLTTIALNKKTL
jgi:hypothetical protein